MKMLFNTFLEDRARHRGHQKQTLPKSVKDIHNDQEASFYWELWSSVRRKKHRISVLKRCSVCLWWVKWFCCPLHLPVMALGGMCTVTEFRRRRMTVCCRTWGEKSSVWQEENIDFTMLSRWIYWRGGCDPTDLFVWAPLSWQCSCCGASSVCTVFVLNGVEGLFPDEL